MDAPRSVATARQRLEIHGRVQGVGFRPHVYGLARALGLAGWVCNTVAGARVEVEGSAEVLASFRDRLGAELPAQARIDALRAEDQPPTGESGFRIAASDARGVVDATVLPDLALCADCRAELFDAGDRRYNYPFINCTQCGPRLSIITGLPYDRAATTMAGFTMCPACHAEYTDPSDRRFHAQPNACPECGPRLDYRDPGGRSLALAHEALARAVADLVAGRIVAVKGLGGFHLMADAANEQAVAVLRRRKHRPRKPLAVMVTDIPAARAICRVSDAEAGLLASAAAPIVLLDRRPGVLPETLAPDNPCLGVMLAYTPLHQLLLRSMGRPLVATSGNLSDEPICMDNDEALQRLSGLADGFLVHDRPIRRPVEDSVMQIAAGRPMVLRAGRGLAPVALPRRLAGAPGLAVGAFLKDAPGLATTSHWVLGAHVGDLDTPQAREAFHLALRDYPRLYDIELRWVARDRHPDYPSTWAATDTGLPVAAVQHHHAHVAAVMAEHGLEGEVLGVAWDGIGLGDDGTAWGGEFLVADDRAYRRVVCLRPFPLPGGDRAAREPWRCAAALRWSLGLPDDESAMAGVPEAQRRGVAQMLERGVNCPSTSSVGRLFDAVASLLGLCQVASFEAEAAMAVQCQAERGGSGAGAYPLPLLERTDVARLDWAPLVSALLADRAAGVPVPVMAGRFHNALAAGVVAVARGVGLPRVVLGGGCFQNRHLLGLAVTALGEAGFQVYWPETVPAGDGGIALGQLAVAAATAVNDAYQGGTGDVSGRTG